jgi:hypothetical protein
MKVILLILNRKHENKTNKENKTDDKDLRIKQLELELTQAREDMQYY